MTADHRILHAKDIKIGDKVRKIGGRFKGVIGTVVDKKPKSTAFTYSIRVDYSKEKHISTELRQQIYKACIAWQSTSRWIII